MSTTDITQVTFAYLPGGERGIRGPEKKIYEDAMVTVTRRDGTECFAVVDRVIWTGDGVALATIVPPEELGECSDCGEWGRVGQRCPWCLEGDFRPFPGSPA